MGIVWQAHRPSYDGLQRYARRGALASQFPIPKACAPSDR